MLYACYHTFILLSSFDYHSQVTLQLGSRMGVRHTPRIPLLLELSYFFAFFSDPCPNQKASLTKTAAKTNLDQASVQPLGEVANCT